MTSNFKQRLRDTQVHVNPDILGQLLAARARRKRLKLLKLGALTGVSLLIIGALTFSIWRGTFTTKSEKANALAANIKNNSGISSAHAKKSPRKDEIRVHANTSPQGDARRARPSVTETSTSVSAPGKIRKLPTVPGSHQSDFGIPSVAAFTDAPAQSLSHEAADVQISSYAENRALCGKRGFGMLQSLVKHPDDAALLPINKGSKLVVKNWFVEVLAEPSAMRTLSTLQPYNRLLRKTEQHQAGLNMGFRVGSRLADNWRWYAGLSWMEQLGRFSYHEQYQTTKTVVDAVQVVIRVPGMPDEVHTVYDTNTISSLVQTEYAGNNRSVMLGMPLGVQFMPGNRSSSIYMHAALVPAYLLRAQEMRMMPDGSVNHLGAGSSLRRFQLCGTLGLGMRKTLAPGIFLLMEPRMSYTVLRMNQHVQRQQRLNMGMNFGLSFWPLR